MIARPGTASGSRVVMREFGWQLGQCAHSPGFCGCQRCNTPLGGFPIRPFLVQMGGVDTSFGPRWLAKLLQTGAFCLREARNRASGLFLSRTLASDADVM